MSWNIVACPFGFFWIEWAYSLLLMVQDDAKETVQTRPLRSNLPLALKKCWAIDMRT